MVKDRFTKKEISRTPIRFPISTNSSNTNSPKKQFDPPPRLVAQDKIEDVNIPDLALPTSAQLMPNILSVDEIIKKQASQDRKLREDDEKAAILRPSINKYSHFQFQNLRSLQKFHQLEFLFLKCSFCIII